MNLFKGLMFLEGHFTRPEDVDPDFAPLGNRAAGDRWRRRNHDAGGAAEAPRHGLQQFELLGAAAGRIALDEPFEQLVAANDPPALRCAACG